MTSYRTVHTQLFQQRGRASEHACHDCGKQARDWSYCGDGEFSADLSQYVPRCRSCHIRHDTTAAQRSERNRRSSLKIATATKRERGLRGGAGYVRNTTPEQRSALARANSGLRNLSDEQRKAISHLGGIVSVQAAMRDQHGRFIRRDKA